MDYGFLADATATTHFAIIVAVFIGLLISFRYRRFRPWEAGILLSVIVLWSYYGNCPLTIVEQYLRNLAGEAANLTDVGFMPYYANKFFAISLSSRIVQRTTFFTGGAFFAASLEWLAPFFHMEIFKFRKSFRKFRKLAWG
ncbi:MAG: hypothetical protein A2832_00405 [Candidatus Zambryskibacteria bacterium RIFCSPHIGHO2_01_FULL_44_22b]|uniref:DUF2784 domain-containing protein n=2 Tax=Parcubacteria group TaxID=1794811 RepID=A0A1G2SZE2_9BACT|nr:MAG: hypothetical protein A3B19_02545 [Candidatus Giovannonibacteria bacterium RIFCSPLOWO2_01_FULL_46_32]OHA89731.1 MAG: hypothetical protein A2832_00405 [Candidatus Zambryskibacteria bacterium RIFCSPHIGHO2_01_FULL_44_22b]